MSRPRQKRSLIYIISIGAHLVVGAALAFIPQQKLKEVVAIAFADAPKPKPPAPKTEARPKSNTASHSAQRTAGARSTPQPTTQSTPGSDNAGFTKLGISLDSSSSDGLAVPVAPIAAAVKPVTPIISHHPKVLIAPKEECKEEIVKAKPEQLVRPEYTTEARNAQVEGRVRLELTIDETGAVIDSKVLTSLGYGLDEQAMNAARKMHFHSATRCGKPVTATFVLSMRFVLGT